MDPFTARSPEDLLAIAPSVLGFTPEDSVVMMTFGSPEGAFHARVDLPRDDAELELRIGQLTGAAVRNKATTAAVLTYTDDEPSALAFGACLAYALHTKGIRVIDIIRADGHRFWSLPEDADTAGTPYDVSSHPFTAERVLEGHVVHRNRAELAAMLDPVKDDQELAIQESMARYLELLPEAPHLMLERLREDLVWLDKQVDRYLRDDKTLAPAIAGKLIALCQGFGARGRIRNRVNRENAVRHVAIWVELVRRCPRELLPGPGTVLAHAAWMAGDGALAWCALDRVLDVDAQDPFALHLASLLERAVPPQRFAG